MSDIDELFSTASNLPMMFSLNNCPDREAIQGMIFKGGGCLLPPDFPDLTGHRIQLMDKNDKQVKFLDNTDNDFFDSRFISDSCNAKEIKTLLQYRLNRHSKYKYDSEDLMDILYGLKKWSDFAPEIEKHNSSSESCSDIDEMISVGNLSTRASSKGRAEYTSKEQIEIVAFLIKRKAFSQFKGNRIWKEMFAANVCHGRHSWQSLREHFKKQIFPKLNIFPILPKHRQRFRRAMIGLQVTDSEESDVDGDLAEMGSDTADNDVNYQYLGQNDPQLEEQSHGDEQETSETSNTANLMSQSNDEPVSQSILDMPQLQEQDFSPTSLATSHSKSLPDQRRSVDESTEQDKSSPSRHTPRKSTSGTPNQNAKATTDASNNSLTSGSSEVIIHPSPVTRSKSRQLKLSVEIKTPDQRVRLFNKNFANALTPENPERSDRIDDAFDHFGLNSAPKNRGQHSCTPSEVSSAERSFQKSLVYDNERETHAVALPLNNSARSASSSEMPTGSTVEAERKKKKPKVASKSDAQSPRHSSNGATYQKLHKDTPKKKRSALLSSSEDSDQHQSSSPSKHQATSQDSTDSDKTTLGSNNTRESFRQKQISGVAAVSSIDGEMPFSKEEDKKILNFIIQNNYEDDLDRIVVWRLMKLEGVIIGRDPETAKKHFYDRLLKNLNSFGLTRQQVEKFRIPADDDSDSSISFIDEIREKKDGSTKEVAAASKPIQRTSMFYSRSEDEKILAYIAKNRRFSDTGGNLLWKTMEERNIVPDRSSQSMKERFRKQLIHRVETFKNVLSPEDIKMFQKWRAAKSKK